MSNATGTIGVTDVSNILITCGFAIGGTVSGLAPGGTVVLLDNGADPLTVGANSTFNFASPLVLDTLYTVSVGTQPAGQTCTVKIARMELQSSDGVVGVMFPHDAGGCST